MIKPGHRFETFVGDFSRNWTHPWPIDTEFPLKEPKSNFNWCFVIFNDLLVVGDASGLWRVTWNETWQPITDEIVLDRSDYFDISDEEYELAEYMDKPIERDIPWTTLTKNVTSELNCAVHQEELWLCGLFNGKLCVAFDKDFQMARKIETKVARKNFGLVSVGERLVLIGGQVRDTTLGGLGLFDQTGFVKHSRRRRTQNGVDFFLNVRFAVIDFQLFH